MNAIEFRNVSKSYEDTVVLHDFSMVVRQGETKVILGGTGSGKSTLLKMVLGLVKPDQGAILVQGEDITRLGEDQLMPIRQTIGMVFQEGALFDSLSVGENVAYRLRDQGTKSEEEILRIVREVLGFVGLEDTMEKMPSELSGGMRRRVAIARALVGDPEIMLYDEPTAGLDPITNRTICELIMRLRDIEEVSSILVTHDLKAALVLAGEMAVGRNGDRIAFREEQGDFCLVNTRFLILKEGRVHFEGSDEVMRRSNDAYIQEFLT